MFCVASALILDAPEQHTRRKNTQNQSCRCFLYVFYEVFSQSGKNTHFEKHENTVNTEVNGPSRKPAVRNHTYFTRDSRKSRKAGFAKYVRQARIPRKKRGKNNYFWKRALLLAFWHIYVCVLDSFLFQNGGPLGTSFLYFRVFFWFFLINKTNF